MDILKYAAEIETAKQSENLYGSGVAIRRIDAAYGVTGDGQKYSRRLRALAVASPEHAELTGRALQGDAAALAECLALIAGGAGR